MNILRNVKTVETEEVFEWLKSYLNGKVESLASGLAFQTTSGTQKLERAAEAGKLKFQGNKDQFLLNSELQGTLDDTANFLAARDIDKAGEKGGRTEGKSTLSSKDYQAC